MKNKRPLMLFLLACCLAQPALGAKIFGAIDCGQWIRSQTIADRAWLTGFMSGLAMMSEIDGYKNDSLAKVNSANQIFLWMDNYCRANPLEQIGTGAIDLHHELTKKPK